MIDSIKIIGYRCFKHFEMSGLGRINLLVGTNSSGKTSALEALYLLATNSDPQTLWKIFTGRGELRMPEPAPGRQMQPESELGNIFFGHKIKLGDSIQFSALNGQKRFTRLEIVNANSDENPQLFNMVNNEGPSEVSGRLAVSIENENNVKKSIPLTPRGGLRQDVVQIFNNIQIAQYRLGEPTQPINVQYISNSSLTPQELSSAWGSIVLTPDEDRVVSALKSLDPNIERIAANSPYFLAQRGGFVVKVKNIDHPIPIGSLGDGVWRMLALAISLIKSRNGILLIDEIDTGLHYSVMASMWKMIADSSKDYNIQIFATTHSSDCFKALADIDESEISIHRVESGKEKSIRYSPAEIKSAAEYNIEVR